MLQPFACLFVATALVAQGMPLLESRAPHFSEIIQPAEPLLLANATSENTTFLLTYRNGVSDQIQEAFSLLD